MGDPWKSRLAQAHRVLAEYTGIIRGRWDEALEMQQRAQALDPLDSACEHIRGLLLFHGRRYDEALTHYQKLLQLNARPGHRISIAHIHIEEGRYDEARHLLVELLEQQFRKTRVLAALSRIEATQGNRVEALRMLELVEREARGRPGETGFLLVTRAVVYGALGETSKALDELEKAYQRREFEMVFLKCAPKLDPLRSEPRFQALLRKIGLEP
jgi:tetratricopeptide (TPR) repeat protein